MSDLSILIFKIINYLGNVKYIRERLALRDQQLTSVENFMQFMLSNCIM